MNSNLFEPTIVEHKPTDTLPTNVAKIAVIGVGGGGCNMINHMISEGISKIDLIVANTDLQSLRSSEAPIKIQLGAELTKGLGAGMKPDIGRESAKESYEDLKAALIGSDIVFIASGLGGGTGTGAAAVVAKAAKEVNALTVSVVTKPFNWEGKKRAALANIGLEDLKKVSDSIIIIKNDKLSDIIDKNTQYDNAFKIVDNILYQAVNGMAEVILKPRSRGINVDFSDVRTVMQHRGMALMGIGKGKGENAVNDAFENAVKSPLLDEIALSSAKGIILHWTIHPKISLLSITDIMDHINNSTDSNADIIFGTTTDETLGEDEVKLTIVASGFEISQDESEVTQHNPTITKINDNPNSPNYYDTPPQMRGYSIKYSLLEA
jgi:cell division protein FtsZ